VNRSLGVYDVGPPMTETGLPATLERLTERYDPEVFELARPRARIRLEGAGPTAADVVLGGHTVKLEAADGGRPDALLTADEHTWSQIADGVRGGMDAFLSRRLKIRYDLHLGVGFLAATADWGPGGLRFSHVETAEGPISISEAGAGHPVVMLHGLGDHGGHDQEAADHQEGAEDAHVRDLRGDQQHADAAPEVTEAVHWATATSAHSRKPKAPTALIKPASGGG
jgi:hypothetical protein